MQYSVIIQSHGNNQNEHNGYSSSCGSLLEIPDGNRPINENVARI